MPAKFDADVRLAHIDLLNRYADALDTRDWPALKELYTEDAVFSARRLLGVGGPEADAFAIEGRDKLVATIGAIIDTLSGTHHFLSNYVVDVEAGGAAATVSCYLRAYHAGAGPRAHLFEESLGRFDLKTVRIGAAWKIREMQETVMIMLGTPEAFGVGPS
jgi:hypothetical protein